MMNNVSLLFLLVIILHSSTPQKKVYSSTTGGTTMGTKKAAGENLQEVLLNFSHANFTSPPPHLRGSRILEVSSIDELLDTVSRLKRFNNADDNEDNDDVSVGMGGLEYDFYRHSCPQAEATIRTTMARVYSHRKDVPPGLLRLFFHDCFIKGCDASVLLDDSNGNATHQIESRATPNLSLKGFQTIKTIKEELENICPGVVSCADIISIATRDGIVLSGGPFYPLLTGRRDGPKSFFEEANTDIPRPNSNISETLRLFSSSGFNIRETVALLGAHGVGKISCNFIEERINNFLETGRPDPTMSRDFMLEIRHTCSRSTTDGGPPSIASRGMFDSLYYKNLMRGRGVLVSDQELMNNALTRQVVALYASDDRTLFRKDFARSMLKLSNLNVLPITQGIVRLKCSHPVFSSH